jgi:hypothetical protein
MAVPPVANVARHRGLRWRDAQPLRQAEIISR